MGIRDHPRSCGEYSCRFYDMPVNIGSSPLMRGIQSWKDAILLSVRIIPAHAGNTTYLRGDYTYDCNHPRSCGEYTQDPMVLRWMRGSSPLMRGIQRKYPVNLLRIGIIPAHAGNTHLQTNQPIFQKDHPRSCGEYFAGTYLETSEPGSSPLMRGILITVC